ncbi:MAG: hypothetical protein V3V01_19405 [Acidimicrobiales bacterium]
MTVDPNSREAVLAKRARIASAVEAGKRVGYGLFGVAIVTFFIGFFGTLTSTKVSIIVGSMVVGSIILAPAIVFGYGVKAAIREESGGGRSGGGH